MSSSGFSAFATMSSSGFSAFGSPAATSGFSLSSAFGSVPGTSSSGLFGSPAAPSGSTLSAFGTVPATSSSGLFGSRAATSGSSLSSAFGSVPATSSSGLFGSRAATSGSSLSSPFGSIPATSSSGLFGARAATSGSSLSSAFGSVPGTSSSGLFGPPAAKSGSSLSSAFGSVAATSTFGLFGSPAATSGSSLSSAFGSIPATSSSGFSEFGPAAAMSGSGFYASSSGAVPMNQCGSGSLSAKNCSRGLNNHPRRCSCRIRKPLQLSASNSSKPNLDASNSQSCFAFGQFFNWQSNSSSSDHNAQSRHRQCCFSCKSDAEKIQTVAENEECSEEKEELVSNSLVEISRILKGIPQSPHFYQLRNHSELARNCMISSWDLVFEQTVDHIHSLQPDGFWVKVNDLWKTLGELQSLGYNVLPLRLRILELNDVMRELKLHKLEIKGLKIKAENHRAEKSRLQFMILKLEEGMNRVVNQVEEMEKELPKFEAAFAKLSMEPLYNV